jgi:hypothetical protein
MRTSRTIRPQSDRLAYCAIDHASEPLPVILAAIKNTPRMPTHHQRYRRITAKGSVRLPGGSPEPALR